MTQKAPGKRVGQPPAPERAETLELPNVVQPQRQRLATGPTALATNKGRNLMVDRYAEILGLKRP